MSLLILKVKMYQKQFMFLESLLGLLKVNMNVFLKAKRPKDDLGLNQILKDNFTFK